MQISYNSICYHVGGKDADDERNKLFAASRAVQENIEDKMKNEGKLAKEFMNRMCFQNSKIKSLSKNVVKKACISETHKSEFVRDLVNEICGDVYVK